MFLHWLNWHSVSTSPCQAFQIRFFRICSMKLFWNFDFFFFCPSSRQSQIRNLRVPLQTRRPFSAKCPSIFYFCGTSLTLLLLKVSNLSCFSLSYLELFQVQTIAMNMTASAAYAPLGRPTFRLARKPNFEVWEPWLAIQTRVLNHLLWPVVMDNPSMS